MDFSTIREWSQAGAPVLFLGAVIVLWRQSLADRQRASEREDQRQAKFEALLERAIGALTRVVDHLDRVA